jgi:hypothetical protein
MQEVYYDNHGLFAFDLRDAPGRERIAQVVRGALADYVIRL